LIVDDEEHMPKSIERMLQEQFRRISRATKSEKALEPNGSDPSDVVLSGLKTRAMVGPAILKKNRALKEGPPVMVIDGHLDGDFRAEALHPSPLPVLQKPINRAGSIRALKFTSNTPGVFSGGRAPW